MVCISMFSPLLLQLQAHLLSCLLVPEHANHIPNSSPWKALSEDPLASFPTLFLPPFLSHLLREAFPNYSTENLSPHCCSRSSLLSVFLSIALFTI